MRGWLCLAALPSAGSRSATGIVGLLAGAADSSVTGWHPSLTERRAKKGVKVVIPLLLASVDGSTQNLSIFDPVSPPAESIRSLSVLVLAITGAIFVVV